MTKKDKTEFLAHYREQDTRACLYALRACTMDLALTPEAHRERPATEWMVGVLEDIIAARAGAGGKPQVSEDEVLKTIREQLTKTEHVWVRLRTGGLATIRRRPQRGMWPYMFEYGPHRYPFKDLATLWVYAGPRVEAVL